MATGNMNNELSKEMLDNINETIDCLAQYIFLRQFIGFTSQKINGLIQSIEQSETIYATIDIETKKSMSISKKMLIIEPLRSKQIDPLAAINYILSKFDRFDSLMQAIDNYILFQEVGANKQDDEIAIDKIEQAIIIIKWSEYKQKESSNKNTFSDKTLSVYYKLAYLTACAEIVEMIIHEYLRLEKRNLSEVLKMLSDISECVFSRLNHKQDVFYVFGCLDVVTSIEQSLLRTFEKLYQKKQKLNISDNLRNLLVTHFSSMYNQISELRFDNAYKDQFFKYTDLLKRVFFSCMDYLEVLTNHQSHAKNIIIQLPNRLLLMRDYRKGDSRLN